ncbi:bifunctional oligoribonuclease/PAP phosphatase NrnA [Flavobacteriaceae bacterium]|nr:bifunctional oligoribonuclease/PAP phosphatase NrnA [Flavobacteriaceae bacterium]
MNTDLIDEIKGLLAQPKKIVIVPHRNPDGDAMGSSLGLGKFLENTGHDVQVVLPNDIPDFLKWMPGVENTYNFEKQNQQSVRALEGAELVFVVDFNAFHRVGDVMGTKLESLEAKFVMIDHHQQPDPISKFIYSDTSMSSTCEMVYHFITLLGAQKYIDSDVATCLYTGIMTDTGSFKFRSTTSITHRVAADLIEAGADNNSIHNEVYDQNSFNRLQLLGQALQNLKIIEDCNTAYITLSNEELERYDFQKGDTEGIVNYALSIKGIVLAAIFIEDSGQGIIKISLRSKGSFSVNQFARSYFNGGGHDNAAGGKSDDNLEQTALYFENLVRENKKKIHE